MADRHPFDLAPLLELAAVDNLTTLGRIVGVTDRQVRRWQSDGMPASVADRAATALGRHPATVWPDWWAVTLDA